MDKMYKLNKSSWITRGLFLFVPIIALFIGFTKETFVIVNADRLARPAFIEALAIQTADASAVRNLSLQIPAINLDVPLGETGLDEAGHLAVPANPNSAGWYVDGPKLGATGTAIVTGHRDSEMGPGVFYNLKHLKIGEQIIVALEDGSTATFTVDKLESYQQDNSFPWNAVFSAVGPASMRIITCDGVYSPKLGRYTRNLVVYASLDHL
jgi:LPXTG-site transpeptidase (sortase) family protein